MKFKIDENLPGEYAGILEGAGLPAQTVADENLSGTDDPVLIEHCRSEGRVLMTLDMEFWKYQSISATLAFRNCFVSL